MNKQYLLFIGILLIGFSTWAQKLTCADFKNGTFIVPKESADSQDYQLIRTRNSQIEVFETAGQKLTVYGTIEWINDCSYRLKYDGTKMEITEELKFVNDNGGIITEMIKIEDKCFYYKSVLIIDGKEAYRIDGSFCKK